MKVAAMVNIPRSKEGSAPIKANATARPTIQFSVVLLTLLLSAGRSLP
jgi:hypothetical protein